MASGPKASPAKPKAASKPKAAAPAPTPAHVGGIAIFAPVDGTNQDPVQAAMDAAVAEHNAAELKRLRG